MLSFGDGGMTGGYWYIGAAGKEGDIGGEVKVTKEERRERGPALGQRKRAGRSVWETQGEE